MSLRIFWTLLLHGFLFICFLLVKQYHLRLCCCSCWKKQTTFHSVFLLILHFASVSYLVLLFPLGFRRLKSHVRYETRQAPPPINHEPSSPAKSWSGGDSFGDPSPISWAPVPTEAPRFGRGSIQDGCFDWANGLKLDSFGGIFFFGGGGGCN